MILVPAIVSNIVTILRLVLELLGFGHGTSPSQPTWWVSASLLIFVFGIYFAYKLRDAERPYRRLALTLIAYAYTVRIPTAIIYGISGALHWDTHYSQYGPPGQDFGYIKGGLLPQLILWPILTLIGGMLLGTPLLAWLRSGKTMKPAST